MKNSDAFIMALAERIAPDEVDTAPAVLAAAERGGEAWRKARKKDGGAVVAGWMGLVTQGDVVACVIEAAQASWPVFETGVQACIVASTSSNW